MKIVFDTNFFEGLKFDWANRYCIKLLQAYTAGLINVFLPEIIDQEIITHLKKIAADTFKTIKTTLDQTPVVSNIQSVAQVRSIFWGRQEKQHLLSQTIADYEDFKHLLGVTIIPMDCSACSDIFDNYFLKRPPFESSNDKKSEFPDAFAIESIKSYFNGEYVVVSKDKGWREAFASTPDCAFYYESSELFSQMEKLIVEEHPRIIAHQIIAENSSEFKNIIKDSFYNRGFAATDVIDDYVESVVVDSLEFKNIYVEYVDDDYFVFSADIYLIYTATIDYTDPDSWSNLGDGDILYWNKIDGEEIQRDIQFGGKFTFQFDSDTGLVEDITDWDIDLEDTIYFEVNPFEDD